MDLKAGCVGTFIIWLILISVPGHAGEIQNASKKGDLATVKKLVAEGADINGKDGRGWTPLYSASAKGHLAIVELLLKNGADANKELENVTTALKAAQKGENPEIIALLKKTGAK